jgi:hypothetical protein
MKQRWSADVVDGGKIVFRHPAEAMRHLRGLSGKHIVCTFEEWKDKRSDPQNRYWWGVVVAVLADHCGYSSDEMHDALKFKFLRDEAEQGPLVKVRGTSTLSTAEFAKLIDDVRLWAETELHCYIPSPGEWAA